VNETMLFIVILLFLALVAFWMYRNDMTESQKREAMAERIEALRAQSLPVETFIAAVKAALLMSDPDPDTKQSDFDSHMAMLRGVSATEDELESLVSQYASLPRKERLKFCCINRILLEYVEE